MGSSASTMLEAMDVLPVGYRFNPTDDELLEHYLLSKNTGDEEEDDDICIIPELDIYQYEPEEFPAIFSELSIIRADQQWWFFCEQDSSENPRRSAKGGYWNETEETEDVKSRSSEEVIGSKIILTFHRGSSSKCTKTDWVMHEYHLPSNISDGLARDSMKNYVLCMIKCESYHNAYPCPSSEFGGEETTASTIDHSRPSDIEPDNGSVPEAVQLKGHKNPANSIKQEGITFVTANRKSKKAARRNKPVDAGRTVNSSSFHHGRKCCCNEQSSMFDADMALKMAVGICVILLIGYMVNNYLTNRRQRSYGYSGYHGQRIYGC